ncbi:hypothetical protein CRN61_28255, partial [Vibrio vulnificus]
ANWPRSLRGRCSVMVLSLDERSRVIVILFSVLRFETSFPSQLCGVCAICEAAAVKTPIKPHLA